MFFKNFICNFFSWKGRNFLLRIIKRSFRRILNTYAIMIHTQTCTPAHIYSLVTDWHVFFFSFSFHYIPDYQFQPLQTIFIFIRLNYIVDYFLISRCLEFNCISNNIHLACFFLYHSLYTFIIKFLPLKAKNTRILKCNLL